MSDAQHVVDEVPASSVLLVRDGDDGLEVLLLDRDERTPFAGGAVVFPGGKVDPADHDEDVPLATSTSLESWRSTLGVASIDDARGLLVAAIRETFEEAGVLLARTADGQRANPRDLVGAELVRRRLASDGTADWREWLTARSVTLDAGALASWSWWVTPASSPYRYDTRFFVALAPDDQQPTPDGTETHRARWWRPSEALDRWREGKLELVFPTRRNLEQLARFSHAGDAWEAARRGDIDVRRIEPWIVRVDGVDMVQHPFEEDPSEL